MIIVGNTFIDDAVVQTKFCCNLEACLGACCCLEGGRGAPLEDQEVAEIRKAFPAVRPLLREVSLVVLERDGLVEGFPGEYATTCIDRRECAFVYFQDGIAKCSFERAFEEGKTEWRKPLSCHLFPLRIRRFGREVLRYEQIAECRPALARGAEMNLKLHHFLKSPLVRRFGEDWYGELERSSEAE